MISMLKHVDDGGVAVKKCVDMLCFCARHSMMAAARVAKSTQIIDALRLMCLNATKLDSGATVGKAVALSKSAMELLAVLCQSGKPIAQQIYRSGILDLLKQFILAPVQSDHGMCQSALHVWRVCLAYGIDTENILTVL